MRVDQSSQNFFLPPSSQEVKPRWQTVAKWAAGISLALIGTGLAVYACRTDWFLSGLPGTDAATSDPEDSTLNQIPNRRLPVNGAPSGSESKQAKSSQDHFLNLTAPYCETDASRASADSLLFPNLKSGPSFELILPSHPQYRNDTLPCNEVEPALISCFDADVNGTLLCEELEWADNSTLPCEEVEEDQEWLVCEKKPELEGLQQCEILKNVCIRSAEQPRSFLASAGSSALQCAARAGSKVCSSTANAGKAALRTLGWAGYRAGRMCVKGLLAAKVSHHTLGTADPNQPLIRTLGTTPLRCLTHDLAPLLRHHGFPLA